MKVKRPHEGQTDRVGVLLIVVADPGLWWRTC